MMKYFFLMMLHFVFLESATASLLYFEGVGRIIENVQLPSGAIFNLEGEKIKLVASNPGIRTKKVVFVNVKVYVGQLFLSSPEKFKKSESEALDSLDNQRVTSIQLHFLRDLPVEKIQTSFKDALKENQVDIDEAPMKSVLAAIQKSGDVKQGEIFTLVGAKLKDGTESFYYESTKGLVSEVKGPPGLIKKMFSIWLGKPTDDGVLQLKKALLNDLP